MSGRKNGIARHPSPCYIGQASVGHCSKPVNNPAGDRTVSCYQLGYRPYSLRCPADLRPGVAATSAEKTPILRQTAYGHRPVFGRSPEDVRTESVHVTELCFRWGELGGTKKIPPSSTDAGHRPGYVTGPLALKQSIVWNFTTVYHFVNLNKNTKSRHWCDVAYCNWY